MGAKLVVRVKYQGSHSVCVCVEGGSRKRKRRKKNEKLRLEEGN